MGGAETVGDGHLGHRPEFGEQVADIGFAVAALAAESALSAQFPGKYPVGEGLRVYSEVVRGLSWPEPSAAVMRFRGFHVFRPVCVGSRYRLFRVFSV